MNSRVSWSVEGIEPTVRERAEAAARRAGMSLGDWLNSTIGESSANYSSPHPHVRSDAPRQVARPPLPERDVQDVAEIHQRLDSITRQIDQMSRPAVRGEPGVARQLNDAISRLDARLSQIGSPASAPPMQDPPRTADMVERAAAQVYNSPPYSLPSYEHAPPYEASPPLTPSLDFAIAEIAARQHELDGAAERIAAPRRAPMAPPAAPAAAPQMPAPAPAPVMQAPAPDMSGLERQLSQITSKIEALQRPDTAVEQSIAVFRSELAEIRNVITEALPRRAIESLENEIRSLGRRIDDSKHSGIDGQALAGLERALADIYQTLRTLTPAEQLAGFDETIRNLGTKIDLIVRSSDDPGTLQQLDSAIAALRAIVANVASNEALARVSDDVQRLSAKVDQIAQADNHSESFAALEARIATLTTTLENRDRPVATPSSEHLEAALRALSDRLDNLSVGNDSSSTFAHLEQRVSYLLERLEHAADHRSGNLGRVEDGLQDILRHLERQQTAFGALVDSRSNGPSMDPALVDTIKRELSDMRFSQTETDRHTQDSLEVVHNTLGHVVDRLAMIEGDLRAVRAAPAQAPVQAAAPQPAYPPIASAPIVSPPRPELQNPAQSTMQVRPPQSPAAPQPPSKPQGKQFDAAPREFAATAVSHEPAPSFVPKAISDILDPRKGTATAATARTAIAPDLPPDYPLEPGTRPQGRAASPSERIAASEEAISELSSGAREQATASSFIAAARRAAQAAASAPGGDKSKPAAKTVAKSAANTPAGDKGASTISAKIRSLLVGASVVVIVLGSFKVAMTLLDGSAPAPVAENSQPMQLNPPEPIEPLAQARPATPSQTTPAMTSPTPIGRQSMAPQAPAPQASAPQAAPVPFVAELAAPQNTAPAALANAGDVTGSIAVPQAAPVLPASNYKLSVVPVPAAERLPDAIGGAALRNAALKGDATAAYEIGVRYAEGKGVPQSYDEAAKWYDRAAQAGVVPAMFRLGTLYEKGLSVKKDLDTARRYYMQAADRGNAKAMHNLAVLEADGGTKGANYKSASQWFRKAAERGVADSQFNLGILYARGIGVDQNLAESFKWFSLAAAQGDADSGRKRDDIAKRLDPQSLAAARLAVQTFVPEGQPDDAINVATPAGGWDAAPAQTSARPMPGKRAAR
jgi:localization factor PodJL